MRKYLLAGLALVAAAGGANAASNSTNFNVTVNVTASCTVSATAMNFGNFTGSIPAGSTATSTATVVCNKSTPYALSLGLPATVTIANAIGSATATMVNGAATIPAALTVNNASQTATGGNDTTTINGSITAAQTNPVAGTYSVSQPLYVIY